MDGLKLDRWKRNFEHAVLSIKIEYDSYFRQKPLEQCYVLVTDEVGDVLTLEIRDSDLPEHVKLRLEDVLEQTKPEDSV